PGTSRTLASRQRKADPRPAAHVRVDPDPSPVALDDLAARGQPDAGPRADGPAATRERQKYPLGLARVDAQPVVRDGEHPIAVAAAGLHAHLQRRRPAVLDGVLEQVLEQPDQQVLIRPYGG